MRTVVFAIIDDDPIFRMTTRHFIKKTGTSESNVLVFENGKFAIDYLKKHELEVSQIPDVILLDLNMPILDGWEFLSEFLPMKEHLKKRVNLYIVTSSIDRKDKERADRISAVKGYLIKPIRTEEIVHMVEKLEGMA